MDETQTNEELYISRVNPDQRELRFDTQKGKHILKLHLKGEIAGIACAICGTPIEKGYNKFYEEDERIYFCPKHNIFMHKQCLVCQHLSEQVCTLAEPEHSDFNVDVEIDTLQ